MEELKKNEFTIEEPVPGFGAQQQEENEEWWEREMIELKSFIKYVRSHGHDSVCLSSIVTLSLWLIT